MTGEPRIVTPREAETWVSFPLQITPREAQRLAHTVATEPDRTRAAVVKVLQHASQWVRASSDRDALAVYIRAIKNGADY